MACIGTPLSDEQLIDALYGEAEQDVQDHLSQCAYCRQRLIELQRFEQRLDEHLHPDRQQLLDFAFDMVDENASYTIRNHLTTCETCNSTIAEFETYKQTATQTVANNTVLRQPLRREQVSNDWLGELIATFIPQSRKSLAFLGADTPDSFIAEAGDVKLFLHRVRVYDNFTLSGQIVAEDQLVWEKGVVALTIQNEEEFPSLTTLLDDLGQFTFSSLPPGNYKLRIVSLSNIAVTLYNLDLT